MSQNLIAFTILIAISAACVVFYIVDQIVRMAIAAVKRRKPQWNACVWCGKQIEECDCVHLSDGALRRSAGA